MWLIAPEMELNFYKYQGTGNDFVLLDNRDGHFPKENTALVAFLCDRRFGIGADGLILLEDHPELDFTMVYYNSDGNQSTMCGNGGRCIVAFAHFLGVMGSQTSFMAVDGPHTAEVNGKQVSLQMKDVSQIEEKEKCLFLDTGSPHHVQLVGQLDELDVQHEGAKLRYGLYGQKGSNINFVEPGDNGAFKVRTYERGVEGETLSCGTGVTAVALAMHHLGKTSKQTVAIEARGGHLEVSFAYNEGDATYRQVYLKGQAEQVFKGSIDVDIKG